jgi:hypothetical protein
VVVVVVVVGSGGDRAKSEFWSKQVTKMLFIQVFWASPEM